MAYSVIGLARSGVAASNALARRGFDVQASDIRTPAQLADFLARLEPRVKVKLGSNAFRPGDTLVMSPGIKPTATIFAEARAADCEIIGEVALFQRLRPQSVPILAVTGTDGKSTTTSWLGHIMSQHGPVWTGGNLGTPLCESLSQLTDEHVVVAEISCFQLSTSPEMHPKVAVFTNLAPDHLDYYSGSYDEYQAAKKRLLGNQGPGDATILNADDPILSTWEPPPGARRVLRSRQKELSEGVFSIGPTIEVRLPEFSGTLLEVRELPIPGTHNVDNAMGASAAALIAGATVDEVREGLRTFGGLEHRMERVRTVGGVTWYNDSKATNPHAAMAGLGAFDEPIVLICGGSAKGADFTEWADVAVKQCRHIVACGATAGQMLAAVGGRVPTTHTETMADAVEAANEAAAGSGVAALSPACASFDQFDNFEHRGRVFKDLVNQL